MTTLRLVTWNCLSGSIERRVKDLESFDADIIVLQECAKPAEQNSARLWFGDNKNKGVGVVARNGYQMEALNERAVQHSVFPVRMSGPLSFNLLAVWAQRIPSYLTAINNGLTGYSQFIKEKSCVMTGDFNSPMQNEIKKLNGKTRHQELIERLKNEYRLASAYHTFHPVNEIQPEQPTQYHRPMKNYPFHIDYCFVPIEWTSSITQVQIGGFEEWVDKRSDHRPVFVELKF
jgi:endonuclease/exonuclease/phosphatase family metal-dependent hydrolase